MQVSVNGVKKVTQNSLLRYQKR